MSSKPIGLLDNIRINNGPNGLKNYVQNLLQENREKAFELINDTNLQFRTLYLLRNLIRKADAENALNPLFLQALEMAAELTGTSGLTGQNAAKAEKNFRQRNENAVSALQWMIKTGSADRFRDGAIDEAPDKEYDRLMERAAALLTKSFRDTTVLPELAEMIFTQYRNGKLIHELVWAFFEARNPESLLLIALRLNSPDRRDKELAERLLCFIPEIGKWSRHTGLMAYNGVLYWLRENKPFMYYTGESLHLCSSPRHYAVSLPAKYLCRPVSVDTGEPLSPFNELETKLLQPFRELSELIQQKLADFSLKLYGSNIYQWNTWIQLPLNEQISFTARMNGGMMT